MGLVVGTFIILYHAPRWGAGFLGPSFRWVRLSLRSSLPTGYPHCGPEGNNLSLCSACRKSWQGALALC